MGWGESGFWGRFMDRGPAWRSRDERRGRRKARVGANRGQKAKAVAKRRARNKAASASRR